MKPVRVPSIFHVLVSDLGLRSPFPRIPRDSILFEHDSRTYCSYAVCRPFATSQLIRFWPHQAQHASYNQALNKLIERSGNPAYTNARIRYEHLRVIDSFYTPPSGAGLASGSGKVRLTTDAKTGEVKECIQKVRIADMNIYSPKRKLDWRVSVNTEIPGASFRVRCNTWPSLSRCFPPSNSTSTDDRRPKQYSQERPHDLYPSVVQDRSNASGAV